MRYKLDFSTQLRGLDGEVLRGGFGALAAPLTAAVNKVSEGFSAEQKAELGKLLDKAFGKEMSLANAAADSLLAGYEDEKNLGGEEKIRRLDLARRFCKGGVQEFNTTERDLIKQLVGKNFIGPLIYGLVVEALEGAEKVKDPVVAT